MKYVVTVTQTAKELSDVDDMQDNPSGSYEIEARSADAALDEFHATVPIGCLEDFEIIVEQETTNG
jgi:hypothetical protein